MVNPLIPLAVTVLGLFSANIFTMNELVHTSAKNNTTIKIPFLDGPANLSNNSTCTNFLMKAENPIMVFFGKTACSIDGASQTISSILEFLGLDSTSFLITIITILILYLIFERFAFKMISGVFGWFILTAVLMLIVKLFVDA